MSAKIFSYVISLLCITQLDAITRIAGNAQTRNGDTFSFPIKKTLVTADQRMIVAAQESGAGNFSLSYLDSGATQFKALAPEKIILNGQKDQNNPIFDAAIADIASLNSTNIAIVTADNSTQVYCHNFGLFKSHLFQTKPLLDATGTYPTSGITALAAGNGYAFVAVKGHGQESFGTGDSGIALIKFSEIYSEQELDQKALEKIKEDGKDLTDEEKAEIQKALYQDKDGKTKKKITTFGFSHVNTAPLNNTHNVLKVGDADVAIEEITDMYYSAALDRVYIACKLSGSGTACAIAVGHVDSNGNLQLSPLVAPHFCKQDGLIVGLANYMETIRRVRTLQTSTGYLDYLIVFADNSNVKRDVIRALPLVNFKQEDGTIAIDDMPWHGTLAPKNSSLMQAYGPKNPKTGRSLFLGRHFTNMPLSYADLNIKRDCEAALVGANLFKNGTIDSIDIQGDCVYVIINNAKDNDDNGVYQSHAIFAHDGRIAAWTKWQKIYNSDNYVASYGADGAQGIIISEGRDGQTVRSVGRTSWNTELQDSLAQIVSKEFPKENGGIQGLFDFEMFYQSSSLLCISGKEKVMLVTVYPTNANENKVHVLNENELSGLGAISAAEVPLCYTDLLWIGGVGGLALLEQDGARGIITCKKVGNFSFVKKLIFDECYLFVLTDTTLDRIDIAKSDFKNDQLVVTRLANADDLLSEKNSYFYDCIVSGPLALLAHNKGLSRIANDHDVRVDDMQTIAWADVSITPKSQPCIALSVVSVTGRPSDVARHGAGQIYAVCGSKQERNAKVYRLAVTQQESINDTTVVPLNDYVVKDLPPFYFNLRSYTPGFFTDGTLSFITQNKKKRQPASITSHYGTLRNETQIKINDASTITHMVRVSATGKWVIAGDFGLVVNE